MTTSKLSHIKSDGKRILVRVTTDKGRMNVTHISSRHGNKYRHYRKLTVRKTTCEPLIN